MYLDELSAVVFYFLIVRGVGFLSYRRSMTANDFIIGGRSMNYWLTALAAHASDMSAWLFMAYPATVFTKGLFSIWTAIGLLLFMFLNWQLIAPKIRVATEQYNSLTFSSFFESRLADPSGLIRIFTALMSLFFYTIYISAGLVGLGEVMGILFGLDYYWGIFIGILIIVPYVFTGGYLTLAWIDFFQGTFLMLVIIAVPLYILPSLGWFHGVAQVMREKQLSLSLFPDFSGKTFMNILFIVTGWGLGYFGQPHIVTKFMGIRSVHEIRKSQYIGMSWMFLSVGAATLVGLTGIAYFKGGLANPELVFIEMVRDEFSPFLIGFILCAVLAATINAMSSQVLVLSSVITEDFYKKIVNRSASSRELLFVSRLGVIVVALLSFGIAYIRPSTIYGLVLYAWSGLGSSFGPLLIFSLYSKKINQVGAWGGILGGGITAAVWPYLNKFITSVEIPSMLPGFLISIIAILTLSYLTQNQEIKERL